MITPCTFLTGTVDSAYAYINKIITFLDRKSKTAPKEDMK
jgi:hypothetical protein